MLYLERIGVGLRGPDSPATELLDSSSARWSDGRETSLRESPLSRALGDTTAVRSEEVVVEWRSGRAVTALVNATPIRSESGEAASVVVTLQDLALVEELDWTRAEFLEVIPGELRSPTLSIEGCTATSPARRRPRGPAEALQFFRIIDEQSDRIRDLIGDIPDLVLSGAHGIELMEEVLSMSGGVPAIFLAAYGEQEIVTGASEKGLSATWSSRSLRRNC